jgi:HAD superfamily hydrolase (TIGR01509 family)
MILRMREAASSRGTRRVSAASTLVLSRNRSRLGGQRADNASRSGRTTDDGGIHAPVAAGVIFDCDGVLVDTEPVANRVLAELLTEHGLPTTTGQSMERYMGRSMASTIAISEELLGASLPAGFAAGYYATLGEEFARELEPVPGIVEALEHIDEPTCVASSGPHEKIRLTLGLTGLLPRFDGRIFSAADVAHGKPEPDLFLHAAASMGFDPARTVVVEDTVPGVLAGRAAGMRVLAFARLTAADALAGAGGEVFDDMRVLPQLLLD